LRLSGFVGDEEVCDSAAEEWQQALDDFSVPYFHSLEFWERSQGGMTGKYRHLHICEARDLLLRLMESVKPLTPVAMAIDVNTFKDLSEDERRYLTTNVACRSDWPAQGMPSAPYFMAFNYCIISPLRLVPEGQQIFFTFDRQDNYREKALESYDQIKKLPLERISLLAESVTFTSKKDAVLLQAADLLTYLTRWYLEHTMTKPASMLMRDMLVRRGIQEFVLERDHVTGVNAELFDNLLVQCPLRSSFWVGMSEPDLIEELRSQVRVLPQMGKDRTYYSHHIPSNKVKVLKEVKFEPQVKK
jgi:hypothetical protein